MFHIGGNVYELVKENKSGWNLEVFRNRYSEVLERYDYVVGDWGYNQLRLRGFFKEVNPRMTKESSIANLEDYINEYCNFGCAYFVLEKVGQSDRTSEEVTLSEDGTPVEGGGRPEKLERPDRYNRSGEPARPVRPARPETTRPSRERSGEARPSGGAASEREPGKGGERVQWPDRKPSRGEGDRPNRPHRSDRSERGGERAPEGRPHRSHERSGGARGGEHGGAKPERARQERPERAHEPQHEGAARGERPDKRPHRKGQGGHGGQGEKPRQPEGVADISSVERRPGPSRNKRRHGGNRPDSNGAQAPEQREQRPPRQKPQGPAGQPPAGQ